MILPILSPSLPVSVSDVSGKWSGGESPSSGGSGREITKSDPKEREGGGRERGSGTQRPKCRMDRGRKEGRKEARKLAGSASKVRMELKSDKTSETIEFVKAAGKSNKI